MRIKKVKKLISRITLLFGFTIQKVPALRLFNFKSKGLLNPVYIEFIGASAVGKTTLYRKLNKKYIRKWLDIRQFAALNSHKNIEELIGPSSFYHDLANSKISITVENSVKSTGYDKLKSFYLASNAMKQDAYINYFNKKHTILSEEGLLQFYSEGVIKLFNENREKLIDLLNRRAIIYCYASPEIIVQRVLLRKEKTGHLWQGHKVSSEDELLRAVKRTLDEKEKLINIVKEFVPVLKINTAQSTASNLKEIHSFIERVRQLS